MSDLYDAGPTYTVNMEHLRWGRFSMGAPGTGPDVSEVIFVQTAVSLGDPEQTQLVEQLTPVREAIEPELLGFENLIQRDLDDARVSNALIPYLLESESGMARMFPSILVLLLPVKHERTEKFYFPVQPGSPVQSGAHERVPVAYGDGDRQWAFEFSRLRTKAGTYLPFGAHLRVNPQFCKFAIIDGQHRAMALLALWRNLNKWPDPGKPFKDFYANHPREKLLKLDLGGLSLPVTICFFPQLHAGNPSAESKNLSVIKAARKLFLDVNRNAKTPSKARQVLLDDTRITSDFVRAIMTQIKDKPAAKSGLRLWNLYYDQLEDHESALPKIAVTSVLHLQFMLRMLLLGARPHKGERLVTRTDFGVYDPGKQDNNRTLVELLSWETRFSENAASWKDETVPSEYRDAVVSAFAESWGRVILNYLEQFPAFQSLGTAAAESKTYLEQSTSDEDPLVLRMMFEGQGVRAVHDAIRDAMEDQDGQRYPFPEATKNVFRKQGKRLAEVEEQAIARAAELYWAQGKPWPTWMTTEQRQTLTQTFSTALCARLFKTKAFQVGVIMAIGHVERTLAEERRPFFWKADVPSLLIEQLAAYFRPSAIPGNNYSPEKAATWVKDTIQDGRIGGFVERGLYRHVRDVLGGDLKDGRWQLAKYCTMEIVSSRVKEVTQARELWLSRKEAEGIDRSNLDDMLAEVGRIIDDANWQYRERLLVHALEEARKKHRRDTGHEASDEEVKAFWLDACDKLAQKLEFSLKSPEPELKRVRNYPRRDAEQAVDQDDLAEAEDNSSPS